jgi:hypothetical protein
MITPSLPLTESTAFKDAYNKGISSAVLNNDSLLYIVLIKSRSNC